jgi:membrane protein YqaA with SNARE-associated domain
LHKRNRKTAKIINAVYWPLGKARYTVDQRKKERLINIALAIVMTLFILFWFFIFFFVGINEFIRLIGIKQAYASVFVLSLIGAFTSLTSVSAYPAIAGFVSAGLSPFLIAVVASIGMIIGDLFFFLFGKKVKSLIPKKNTSKIKKFIDLDKSYVPWLIYLYVAFTPLPNNLLTAWLAVKDYKVSKLIIPLSLGDTTLPFIISYGVYYGLLIWG